MKRQPQDSMVRRAVRLGLLGVAVGATIGILPALTPEAYGGTIRITMPRIMQVPGDYATLQEAIDAAQNGDKIIFRGSFNGDLDLKGKRLTIIMATPSVERLAAEVLTSPTQAAVVIQGRPGERPAVQLIQPSPEDQAYRAYYAQPLWTSEPGTGPVYRPFDYRVVYFVNGQPVEVLPPPYPDYYFTRPALYYPSYYYPYGGYYEGSSLGVSRRAPIYTITPDSAAARGEPGAPPVGRISSGGDLPTRGPTGGSPTRRGPTAGLGGTATGRLPTGSGR